MLNLGNYTPTLSGRGFIESILCTIIYTVIQIKHKPTTSLSQQHLIITRILHSQGADWLVDVVKCEEENNYPFKQEWDGKARKVPLSGSRCWLQWQLVRAGGPVSGSIRLYLSVVELGGRQMECCSGPSAAPSVRPTPAARCKGRRPGGTRRERPLLSLPAARVNCLQRGAGPQRLLPKTLCCLPVAEMRITTWIGVCGDPMRTRLLK